MQNLNTEQLRSMMNQNEDLKLINVLGEGEFQKRHIPGSINIPLDTPGFEREVAGAIETKKSPVVVYCASTSCDASPKAAKKLEQAGFEDVFDYVGGMKAWMEADEKVATSAT